jgi:hypothetical protein
VIPVGSDAEWVVVFSTADQAEADMIHGLLESNGFPVIVQSKGLKGMATLFGHAAVGQLVIKVPPDQVEAARALLEAPIDPGFDDE